MNQKYSYLSLLILIICLSCGSEKARHISANIYYSELLEIFEAAYIICDPIDKSFTAVGLDKLSDLPKEKDGSVVFPFGRFVDGTLLAEKEISIMYDRVGKEYFTFQYRLIDHESEDLFLEDQLLAPGLIMEDRGRVRCKCDEVKR